VQKVGTKVRFEALLPDSTAKPSMDRDAAVEAVVAFVGVALLAGVIMWIGTAYTNDGLTGSGGIALVGAIGFFIVFMSVVGLGLSRRY
jgi:hypothetical protein